MPAGAFVNSSGYIPYVVKFAANLEEQEETFVVQDVPDRGRAVLAARSIKRGEFLFSEPPLFILPPSPTNSMVLGALSKCTREEQQQFFSLSNAYKGRMLPALAIFETNFLLLCNGGLQAAKNTEEKAGIFLLASRINSSCTPNVSKSWDDIRNTMVFRTLRDVEEGEELCYNYCEVLATKETRKRQLLEEFGFDCTCAACLLEGEEAAESDQRRAAVARLFDEVGRCGKEPTLGIRKVCLVFSVMSRSPLRPVQIKLALHMLKQERLVHYEASFCYDAFQFCVMVRQSR